MSLHSSEKIRESTVHVRWTTGRTNFGYFGQDTDEVTRSRYSEVKLEPPLLRWQTASLARGH